MNAAGRVFTLTHKSYGCVKCQAYHFDCEPIYQEHIDHQSKHGTRVASEREHQLHHAFGARLIEATSR